MAPPNPRVAKAFQAMKALGISEKKIKTVLKELLNLYQKNWELIEAENYRALADAIFEKEDTIMQENKKGKRVTVCNLTFVLMLVLFLHYPRCTLSANSPF